MFRRRRQKERRGFLECIPTDRLPTMATFRCFKVGIEVSLWGGLLGGGDRNSSGLRRLMMMMILGTYLWCRWGGMQAAGGMGLLGAAIITWEQWTLAGAGCGLRQNYLLSPAHGYPIECQVVHLKYLPRIVANWIATN